MVRAEHVVGAVAVVGGVAAIIYWPDIEKLLFPKGDEEPGPGEEPGEEPGVTPQKGDVTVNIYTDHRGTYDRGFMATVMNLYLGSRYRSMSELREVTKNKLYTTMFPGVPYGTYRLAYGEVFTGSNQFGNFSGGCTAIRNVSVGSPKTTVDVHVSGSECSAFPKNGGASSTSNGVSRDILTIPGNRAKRFKMPF